LQFGNSPSGNPIFRRQELTFYSDSDIYIFPTVAFAANSETITRSFNDKLPKPKYGESIDLTELQDHSINVHITLAGSEAALQGRSFNFPNAAIIKHATIGTSPVINVVVSATPNS
jgi:hypothetical protein